MRKNREPVSLTPDQHTPERILDGTEHRIVEKMGATGKDTQFLQSQHESTQEMAEETGAGLRNSMPVMNLKK